MHLPANRFPTAISAAFSLVRSRASSRISLKLGLTQPKAARTADAHCQHTVRTQRKSRLESSESFTLKRLGPRSRRSPRLTQITNQIVREWKRTGQPIDPYRVRDELVRRTREPKKSDAASKLRSVSHEAIVLGNGRSLPSPLIKQLITLPDLFRRASLGQRQSAVQGIER